MTGIALTDFTTRLDRTAEDTETLLASLLSDALLPDEIARPKRLMDAMRYSSLAGGKRLRPFLVVESAAVRIAPSEPGESEIHGEADDADDPQPQPRPGEGAPRPGSLSRLHLPGGGQLEDDRVTHAPVMIGHEHRRDHGLIDAAGVQHPALEDHGLLDRPENGVIGGREPGDVGGQPLIGSACSPPRTWTPRPLRAAARRGPSRTRAGWAAPRPWPGGSRRPAAAARCHPAGPRPPRR